MSNKYEKVLETLRKDLKEVREEIRKSEEILESITRESDEKLWVEHNDNLHFQSGELGWVEEEIERCQNIYSNWDAGSTVEEIAELYDEPLETIQWYIDSWK